MCSLFACTRARFTDFRGESLHADRKALATGKRIADTYCGTCHLTPLPESMSQDNAAYMLAYMGLFLGVDASRQLDAIERAQFRQRFELLSKTKQIPATPLVSPDGWAALRAYYLGLARYPYASRENSAPLAVQGIRFADQGVTLLRQIASDRLAVGGAVTGLFEILDANFSPVFSMRLDSAPVHVEESGGALYVLTLGSLLGALDDENKAAIYRIDVRRQSVVKLVAGLPRSGHFLVTDTNGDTKPDFVIAAFGAVSGGSVLLAESQGAAYRTKALSTHTSIARLSLLQSAPGKLEILALAGGAREALLHLSYAAGSVHERILAEYPPHLGNVWLEQHDIDGDGHRDILVLSGDNADAGPYNEAKSDQGLRIYSYKNGAVKQERFESAPGALSLHIAAGKIYIARFYASPDTKQDITVLTYQKNFEFARENFTLQSRPTVLTTFAGQLVIGSGNFPLLARLDGRVEERHFSGPALAHALGEAARVR